MIKAVLMHPLITKNKIPAQPSRFSHDLLLCADWSDLGCSVFTAQIYYAFSAEMFLPIIPLFFLSDL
jgi:hypothetical protein